MSVRRVRDALVAALGPDTHVEHRANHTGVGKLSFAVTVGGRRLWAKVAADEDADWPLTTWSRVADVLAERHAAPPVLDVLAIDGRTALLFPFIDAAVATRATAPGAVRRGAVGPDRAARGRGPGRPPRAADHHRRLLAQGLARAVRRRSRHHRGLRRQGPARLPADEVEALGALIEELDGAVDAPVHGDPWHENFLVAPERLWLLDWEDLAVGDPAVDDAILRRDALGTDPRHWPGDPVSQVARRALMLDSVVDIAADWVEAALLTGGDPLVHRQKEAAYLAGLEFYRSESWRSA